MVKSITDDIFSVAAIRAMTGYSQIDTFRQTGLDSLGNFNRQLLLEAKELADEYAYDDYYGRFIDQSKLSDQSLGENKLANIIHKQKYMGFLYTLNCSCLVFTHSILDGILYDFCRSIFTVAPSSWEKLVLDRSVKLSVLKDKKYDEILAELIEGKFKDIDRASVPAKTDMLFKLCSPIPTKSEPKDYVFCKNKLSAICEKRNTIVHAPQQSIDLDTIDQDLKYLQETGRFFLSMLNYRFNLKIDPSVMLQAEPQNVGHNT